ncbi:MAG: ribonuclease Z [Acidobacteria bacterium]|nr:MAG: ribonuclease Z [Acidobacteriota bacterium]REJ99316.1 MAG: ribonuclease Z [Acidobacteriota bacterium]REK15964.1 MAG: ribonuclease Z [Acidobacteriota bacterium]REK43645.1 MAG: ribonuclease Z [Acidobacteriota bacterium]
MQLTILGSGTSVPHRTRSSSGHWLETSGGSILLDFSASAIHRMAEEKLDWAFLDAIWISHFHLDHIGGLAPFLFGTKYAPETQQRRSEMKIFGPAGLRVLLEAIDRSNDYGLLEQPFPIQIVEVIPLEPFEIVKGVEAVTFDTPHTPESLAIRISDQDATMVYTSDTGFSKPLGSFAKNVDLFLMECSFVKEKPVETHLELAEAVYLAQFSKAKKTVLTHLYPEWDKVIFDSVVSRMRPGCEIVEAADGAVFSVSGEQ